jgi:sortase A
MTGQRFLVVGATLAVVAGALLLGDQAYVRAKGSLASKLIARAWKAHLVDGRAHPPWSWADFWPVARIEAPRLHVERIVLTGATGSAMAFGFGHVSGTALPGGRGMSAIAGHRDSWARFLGELRLGDELRVETRGRSDAFVVSSIEVVPRDQIGLLDPEPETSLLLITCFPFDGLFPSQRRFVVRCRPFSS